MSAKKLLCDAYSPKPAEYSPARSPLPPRMEQALAKPRPPRLDRVRPAGAPESYPGESGPDWEQSGPYRIPSSGLGHCSPGQFWDGSVWNPAGGVEGKWALIRALTPQGRGFGVVITRSGSKVFPVRGSFGPRGVVGSGRGLLNWGTRGLYGAVCGQEYSTNWGICII